MVPASKYPFPIEPQRSRLLGELWQYQISEKYISDAAVRLLANRHHLSEIEVEGVVSFYHFFHRTYSGKHTIYLNNSIVSEIKGFEAIKNAFEKETGARMGTIDPTGTFGFYATSCIGLSDHEPAALIDFYPFVDLNEQKVKDIVQQLRNGKKPGEICDTPSDNLRYLPPNGHRILWAPYIAGEAVGKLKEMKAEEVLGLVQKAEIRGRGGAFYHTWLKWDACRKQPASPRFVICNADEGEPGTFKDRVLLNSQTGSVLEGMIIAGYVTGACYGIIYLRGEYRWLEEKIQREIEAFRDQGLLGVDVCGIKGFNFDIRIEIGAGAYVCGEETALLESLEGKRGEPRTKWYFPVEKGYLQLPTVINNVETFSTVARLLEMGLPEYLKRGIPGSPGTKLISISGDCKLPGIYEIEWGMPVADLLDICQADDPYVIQVSGPSGNTLSMAEKHKVICMPGSGIKDGIACGGSFMVFHKKHELLDILLNFSEFFKHESCGVCTPCRAGNFIIQRKLAHLIQGTGDLSDLEDLKKWAVIMETSSRCGLGKTAGNSVIDAIERFGDYFSTRLPLRDESGILKFDLEASVAEYEKFKPTSL
jgi:[NiFe] hydrogenase diaphorase moiety large subunit